MTEDFPFVFLLRGVGETSFCEIVPKRDYEH
jgi:hypothetical protein